MPFLYFALSRPFALAALTLTVACAAGTTSSGGAETATPAADAQAAGAAVASTATAGPSATLTVVLTPKPSAPPADMATAQRLEAEGDLPAALDAYVSLTRPGSASRTAAILGEGRVLLAMDRAADARSVLEPFVQENNPGDAPAARYLLGRAFAALKLPDQALAQFDAYVQSGRPAAPYAQYDRAIAYLDLGQPATAALAAQNGLAATLPAGAKRTFTLLVAQSYERANQPGDALRWYQTLFDQSPGDQALALSRMIAIKRAQGDTSTAPDLQKLLSNYPSSPQALTAMKDALGRGDPIDPYIKGLVYYRQNDYTNAQPALEAVVAAAPNATSSAEAYYFLGAIYESQDKKDAAITAYGRVPALNAASSLADDALWWRGRLLEGGNRLDDALEDYRQLATGYPSSTWAADANFRLGLVGYRRKDYAGAAKTWSDRADRTSDKEEKAHLTLWAGKSYVKNGDKTAARSSLQPLSLNAEDDYYGVRAGNVLQGQSGPPKATRESKINLAPNFEWAAAETWLAQAAGKPVTPVASQAWFGDNHWKRAEELWLLGRESQGDTEAFDLIATYATDPVAMYTLARQLAGEARISMSARAGQRLLRDLDTNPNQGLPTALMSLSYPAAYATSIQKASDAQKISPLLMLAFIRQESFFDPGAESGAGAVGLTQLLPGTARTLAPKVDVRDFDPEKLTQADLNVRIGAAYMAQQLKDFDNSIFAAFAAYNAGPNSAATWYKAAKSDGDEFVEEVEFSETRLYIRNVSENYAIYRYLYGGEDVPSLPGD